MSERLELPYVGERRRTLWKKRVVICVTVITGKRAPKRGGVQFVFEDEPTMPFQRWCSFKTWRKWTPESKEN